jgi:hypothetical protein
MFPNIPSFPSLHFHNTIRKKQDSSSLIITSKQVRKMSDNTTNKIQSKEEIEDEVMQDLEKDIEDMILCRT